MLRVVSDADARAEMTVGLDEICRDGASRMLAAGLEAEAELYVESLADQRDERSHRLVVRNGHAEPRTITTAAEPSRSKRLASTTAASTPIRLSAAGSAARSCPRGAASPRRWPRCCH